MKKSILHRLLTVLLCLAAVLSGCQTSLPFFPTATPTITASPTLTKTATPAPTPTETPTLRPTETPMPIDTLVPTVAIPHYEAGLFTDESQWTTVANEDVMINTIVADIVKSSSLLAPNARNPGMGNIVYQGDSAYVDLGCFYGENCIVRASVRVPIAGSQEYHHYLIWEVMGMDNKPHILTLYAGSVMSTTPEWWSTQHYINNIQSSTKGFTLSLLTRSINRNNTNLYMYAVTDGLDPTLIDALNSNIIPDDIWKTIIFGQFN
jgi:hypothetical protein